MSRFEEKSHKEIADYLEISEKAVEYHITQSLKYLRSELKDFLI
jgi:DNA-directed RNA polymerase specialized sigma subunit